MLFTYTLAKFSVITHQKRVYVIAIHLCNLNNYFLWCSILWVISFRNRITDFWIRVLLLEVDRDDVQGESDETDNLTAIPIQVGNLQIDDATVSITDVSLLEGNSGTTDFVFDVTLSKANDEVITVDYTTADGTAIAGKDYTATNGTLTFNAGEISKTVTVSVTGENRVEIDETFFINLSNVTNGDILDAQGEATITNDDEIQLSNNNVDENSANGTVIGNFSATDASDTDRFSFNLLDNAGGRFTLNGSQLQVADGTLLDFESNTSHSVTVRATDSNGNDFDRTFTIAIDDINEMPVANDDTATTDEDNSVTINVLANDTDEDGDTLTIDRKSVV